MHLPCQARCFGPRERAVPNVLLESFRASSVRSCRWWLLHVVLRTIALTCPVGIVLVLSPNSLFACRIRPGPCKMQKCRSQPWALASFFSNAVSRPSSGGMRTCNSPLVTGCFNKPALQLVVSAMRCHDLGTSHVTQTCQLKCNVSITLVGQ